MLDAAFFPHIIDEIFAYAPLKSLLALRVNKAWCRRAEAQLPYHVIVSSSPNYPGHYAIQRAKKTALWNWPTPMTSINPIFLAATAVVDLRARWLNYRTFPLLRHCPPHATFRCHHRCDLSSLCATQTPQPSCLVLFARDVYGYHSISYFSEYGLGRLETPKKLVIHLTDKGMDSRKEARKFCLGGVTSLTLIMHPNRLDSTRPLLTFQLGLLIDLAMLGYVHGAPVTIVNLNFPDFEDRHPEVGSIQTQVLDEISRLRPEFEPLCKGSTALNVRCLSMSEYRTEVGTAQFRIETVEGPIMRPSLQAAT